MSIVDPLSVTNNVASENQGIGFCSVVKALQENYRETTQMVRPCDEDERGADVVRTMPESMWTYQRKEEGAQT